MNRVCIIGRLTSKPELRYTNSNIASTTFTVAVNRPKKEDGTQEADFINCRAWRKQAENIVNYLDKGSLASVEGRIQTGSYNAQDGSKKYFTEVVAERVQFLESKKQTENTSNAMQEKQEDPFASFGDEVSIDNNFLD